MISAKLATPGLLKIKIFQIKVMTSLSLTMTSPTKFYHVLKLYCRCGHVTKVWLL